MGKATGWVHSWLVDAPAFSVLRAHWGKSEGGTGEMHVVHWAAMGYKSVSSLFLCVSVCAHSHRTIAHSTAVQVCTLTVLFHQLETARCSYSQLIGGWPVTLVTQAGGGKKHFSKRFKRMDFKKIKWYLLNSPHHLTFTSSLCQHDERKYAPWRFKQQNLRKYTKCWKSICYGENMAYCIIWKTALNFSRLLSETKEECEKQKVFQTSWLINELELDFERIVAAKLRLT